MKDLSRSLLVITTLLWVFGSTCQAVTVACAPTLQAEKWSTVFAGQTGVITIDNGRTILLDVESVTVAGINIVGGAKLYFDWQKSIVLTTGYIKVAGGSIFIGTEACPFENKVTINLVGATAITLNGLDVGVKAFAVGSLSVIEMHGAKGLARPWTRLARTAEKNATTIKLVDAVATGPKGWEVGDQIVLATTDYDPYQSEIVTIQRVIDASTLEIAEPLKFMHFGQVTDGVDERAEVALMSRNILIQGAGVDNVGGHLMMYQNVTLAKIEGVQFLNMGQRGIARYPLHFHLIGRMTGSYVKANSIQNSNFRCIVLHAVQGLLVDSNVAYNIKGHCLLLEDGVEVDNTINNNAFITIGPKTDGDRLGSDDSSDVSAYWITNPDNSFTNNVAAGCTGAGYWIHTRTGPHGPSSLMDIYKAVKPNTTPLRLFKGNRAHGCDHGIQIESVNFDADDIPATYGAGMGAYNPLNGTGKNSEVVFDSFTAHHNRFRGIWARTLFIRITNSFFADNAEGVQVGTVGDHPQSGMGIIEDTLFVGWTDNVGDSTSTTWQSYNQVKKRSFSRQGSPNMGMVFYDGPQIVRRCTFRNYDTLPTETPHSAIGGRFYNNFQIASTTSLQGVVFENVTRRVHISDRSGDGGKFFNFRDDGSVTGYAATTLPNWPYYSTPGCVVNGAYGLVCPHRYSQLWVVNMGGTIAGNTLTLIRNDRKDANHTNYAITVAGFVNGLKHRYQPIVSVGASYLLTFSNSVPSTLGFQLNNAELGQTVSLAICYPAGATITKVSRGYSKTGIPSITLATSNVTNISNGSGRKSSGVVNGDQYYWDSSRGMLFITLKQRSERSNYQNFCPPGGCDFVWVEYTGNAAAPNDCINKAYGSDSLLNPNSAWLQQSLTGGSNTSGAPVTTGVDPATTTTGATDSQGNPTDEDTTSVASSLTVSLSTLFAMLMFIQ